MQTQQTPQVLQQPFAAQGDKNTIPNAATGTNKASLQEGFPPITGQPINQGGIPPERADFNGAMNLNSQFYFAFQNGWWPTFTQEVSDAIGGYPQGAVLWLFDTENNAYTPLLSLVGNNTYNFNTNKDYIGQYWAKILPDSGRGLPLGAIYFSSSSNEDDNPGALPLWSGAYYTNASTLYPAFYAWVKSHTELCKTKTEYDAAVSTYGECPYYVVDEVAGSLRLPKLVNYLKMANTTDGVTQSGAGLPDITGTGLYWESTEDTKNQLTGCFFVDTNKKNNQGSSGSDYDNYSVAMDASRSSSIYGASNTVTPAHTTAFPWVVASASDAESSAAAAAQSADAAATSAINASNSASAAAQSAQEAADSAASIDPDNLADKGLENTGRLTNCLTKIPQDINLVLSEGTLTLKAGSKVYDGAGNVVNITSDKTTTSSTNGKLFALLTSSGATLTTIGISSCSSGETDSLAGQQYHLWYDTANKVVNYYGQDGSAVSDTRTLPIALITVSGGKITSIDQVFNGFGYIGNTMFALPGVSVLIPNGRNADGTLNNTAETVSALRTLSFSNQTQSDFGLTATTIFSSDNAVYNAVDNKNYNPITGNRLGFCNCGTVETDSTGVITSLATKTAFHALDYNYLSGIDYVVESYTDAETGQWYRLWKSGWLEQGGIQTQGSGFTFSLIKPFLNTKYFVSAQMTSNSPNLNNVLVSFLNLRAQTTTYFQLEFTTYSDTVWYTCGQGA